MIRPNNTMAAMFSAKLSGVKTDLGLIVDGPSTTHSSPWVSSKADESG
jgi:hypothetical protein